MSVQRTYVVIVNMGCIALTVYIIIIVYMYIVVYSNQFRSTINLGTGSLVSILTKIFVIEIWRKNCTASLSIANKLNYIMLYYVIIASYNYVYMHVICLIFSMEIIINAL